MTTVLNGAPAPGVQPPFATGLIGYELVTLSAATLSLSAAQSQAGVIKFGGAPSGGVTITFEPVKGQLYVIDNESGQTITLQIASQSSPPTLATAKHAMYYCDGASILQASAAY